VIGEGLRSLIKLSYLEIYLQFDFLTLYLTNSDKRLFKFLYL
jgi:hypothetical protein